MGANPSKIEKDFKDLGEEIPEKLIGIENKGATCYLNSVIQSLFYTKEFQDKILESLPKSNTLLKSMQDLFNSLKTYKKQTGTITINPFIKQVRGLNELFNNDYHHDAHEFLIWALSTLDEELKKEKNSWIEEIFAGKSITETICLCCESSSRREELFMDLGLEIMQNSSLVSSLNSFSKSERLRGADKFFCETCNCKQEADRKTLIKQLPKVLICHLKRFKYSEHERRYMKLSYRVAFPSQLRIDNTTSECENKLYELYAVVVHLGPGFQVGHYMAIIKIKDHWIRFDDDFIERTDENLIQYLFGSSKDNGSFPCGYILFYRLVN
jgi:ubiquitin carboxyl-terminal hydrolase 12/46